MNNKKIQAQMQINVSFLAQPTELVKQLQTAVNQLKLSSNFGKTLGTELSKGIKEGLGDINKLTTNLSKKGLSTKEYNQSFDQLLTKMEQMSTLTQSTRKNILDFYNSLENKEGLKTLQELEKTLERVQKLSTKNKANQTRKDTTIQKMLDETGIDYNVSRRTLMEIAKRRKNGQDLTNKQKEWQTNNHLDDAALKRVLELYAQIEDKATKAKNLTDELFKLTGDSKFETAIGKLEKQIAQKDKETLSNSELKTMLPQITNIENIGSKIEDIIPVLREQWIPVMSEAEQRAIATAKATSTLKEVFAQFGIHFSAATIVKGFFDLIKSSFQFYKSLDSALNQIYVVSSLSIERVQSLQSSFLNMAKTTGMALDDVTRAAVLFYQQGLNTTQVLEMTRVTAQFAKVAGIDATDAANKLTAAVNGYRLSAQDAMSVADKFNKVAASSAADINELSTAFSKAAAQANQAGVSMDNYLAYIATMEEKTREAPENIGTSLKTIFSRMQQIKSGENTDDNTTVNDVEKALRTVNIALRDTNGQLRDLEEIFAELGPKWNTLDRNTQAYLGTIIAGTRQQSRFITLMQNWDRVLDLSEQSANSAGQQALMHAKAMDSITSRLQQLKVAWQEFVSNIASSSLFKGAIQGLTAIVNLLNSGTKPMSLLATTISVIAPKLKQLQIPLANFFGDKKGKFQDEISQLKSQGYQQFRLRNVISRKLKNGDYKDEEEIVNKKNEVLRLTQEEEATRRRIYEIEEKQNAVTAKRMQALGMGLNVLGTAIASIDQNLGGIVSATGTLTNMVGQFKDHNIIGGITSGIALFFQARDLIENWTKRLEERVSNAIQEIGNALNDVNNYTTQINSTQKLIDRYNVLTRTIYRTEEEQAELNKIIQELGDTYNVDVLTDAYGNLTINIDDVIDRLNTLTEKQEEAYKKLKQTELASMSKATSGIGNTTSLEKAMRKNLADNRSSYNTLLTGLTQPLIDAAGTQGKQAAQAFSSNLKSAIEREIDLNPLDYASYAPSTVMLKMQKDINTTFAKNDDALSDLYNKIEYLQKNVDNMTFDEAQEYLQRYFDKWHDELNLTEEEWNVLVRSINQTTFKNTRLLQFIEETEKLTKEADPSYWDKKIATAEKRLEEIRAVRQYGAEQYGILYLAFEEFDSLGQEIKDTYNAAEQALESFYRKREQYYTEYAKNHNLYDKDGNPDVYEAQLEVQTLSRLGEAFRKLSADQMPFFNNLKSLYDMSGLTGADKINFAGIFETVSQEFVRQGAQTDADRYNIFVTIWKQNKHKYSAELQAQMEDVLKEAYNNLQVPTPKNLKQIGESLKSYSKDLQQLNSILSDFSENGTMSIDTFTDLASIIESMDFETMANMDPNAVDAYCKAIKNLNLAYDENSDQIKANGQSLKTLQDIQQEMTKAKLRNTRDELIASKATVQAELDYIDAQIAGTQAAIDACNTKASVELKASDVQAQADNSFTQEFDKNTNKRITDMKAEITSQQQWTTTQLKNIGKVAKAYGNLYKGIASKSHTTLAQLQEDIEALTKEGSEDKLTWEGVEVSSGIDWSKYGNGNLSPEQREALKKELENYKLKLENTRIGYQNTFDSLTSSIKFLDTLINADLSKFGVKKEDKKDLQDYIGKLKEVYNILNRINLLEHRRSTLDTYAKIEDEELYGKHLKERIGLTEELLNQYDFLVREQKAWTNGMKEYIKGSAVGDVFDFDEFGQIIVDFEKYNKLSTQATTNTKSLKEQADYLYDTYTNMFSELEKDFDNYISNLQVLIDLYQEVVDRYVETEHDIAKAIREIYQKILKDRLEAIDKEKKALDDLKEARERSRKDQENAKEMSGLQTNLQRAMMDTSGASDSAFIKSQQDIGDKLDKIADDKYSQTLSDIQKALDEEKDALQNDFDEMFEDQHWLFEWIERNLMNDETGIEAILRQTQSWKEQTDAEHAQEEQKWRTRFEVYSKFITGEHGKTVLDVVNKIDELQNKTVFMDDALKNPIVKKGAEIEAAIKNGINSVNSTIKNKKSTVTYNSYYTPSTSNDNNGGKPTEVEGADVKDTELPSYKYEGGLIGLRGQDIEMDKGVKYTLYSSLNDTKGKSYTSPTKYEEDVKLISEPMWSAAHQAFMVEIQKEDGKRYWVKASNDKHGQGTDRYFHESAGGFLGWQNGSLIFGWGKAKKFATGGLANYAGPAWLDGTPQKPEYVLNPLQTEHFMKLTNLLDQIYGNSNNIGGLGNSVVIDTISFNVASMSSVEDGERAFNMFVDKFKEIGNQTGIQMNNFKNTV